jgi:membrane-associated phospholipid phosphatase
MAEALTQRTNPWAWFRGILMCNSKSAPVTHQLVTIANVVGQFVVMYYKMYFHRPRPSQYSPALLPPIEVPGHASFPSGHATESYLIALILDAVMPAAAGSPATTAPDNPPPPYPGISPLQQMAARIARNREVLGLHFPSDSKAGRRLAIRTFEILMECPAMQDNNLRPGLITEAQREWV